jgi:DNA polymerase, archaea type
MIYQKPHPTAKFIYLLSNEFIMGEKLQFFVLDAKYRINNNKAEIYLFAKTISGKQIIVVDNSFDPYFYVIPKLGQDLNEKIKKITVEKNEGEISRVIKTENIQKNIYGKPVDAIKVYTALPRDVPIIRSIIKEWDMVQDTFEYDILFLRRYLIDKEITPITLLEAEVETINRKSKVPAFLAKSINQVGDETLTNPSMLAFDIETYNKEGKTINFEKNPIIMLSFYGNTKNSEFRKVITWKKFKTDAKYIEFVDSEADLIVRFKEIIETETPDIITGYYSDGFDLPYILKRAEKYKIKLDLGLDYSEVSLTKKPNTKASISGIVHLDVLNVIKKLFSQSLKTDYYDLSSVSLELLGEQKLDVDLNTLVTAWDNNDGLEKFCSYNLHDSRLTFKLAQKIMPNIIEMVKTVSLPMFDITRMGFSQLVEWYLIKQAKNFNEIAPNKPHYNDIQKRKLNRYQGGFVFEPKPGLYKDVVIFDFKSLYPTIISSHNISPGTFGCSCCSQTSQKIPIEDENYYFCKNKKGFLPTIIEDLINRRMRIKEMMKKDKGNVLLDARQNNIKVLTNAFYGYFGFFNARWYSIECSRSITSLGRFYIHKVIDKATKEDFNVIYSDTDSIFINLIDKTKEQAKAFAEQLNPSLPGIMELEYDGYYPAAIFVSSKSSSSGAKKRYALLDSNNKIHVKGFETVRRNASEIAKQTQSKILEIVLVENNPDKALRYIKEVINNLKDRKINIKQLIIHTQLNKNIEDYTSIGPHVQIARRLKDQGHDITQGMVIEFIVMKGSGSIGDRSKIPSEITDNNYDSDYYINNQVLPATEKIFEVLGYTKEDLTESKKQSKLGQFF